MRPPLRVVFLGSPEFAVPSLRALIAAGHDVVAVYTQPDRPGGRGQHDQPSPVKRAATGLGLPVVAPAEMRSRSQLDALEALAPDLCVVAAYGHILPAAILDLPRFGFLNVHASLLPRHRGAAPIPGAILAGDDLTGVTIMRIDPGLDSGPMLAKATTAIGPDDTTATLLERLATLGAELLAQTIPAWVAGEIEAEPQDEALATFCPRIEKEQGEIDWTRPSVGIWRAVRAYQPWPTAYTHLGDQRVTIHEAWPVDVGHPEAPGTALGLSAAAKDALGERAARAGFAVATGEGLLVPLILQRAGRRRVDAASFVNGERDLAGRVFGPLAETPR